MGIRHGSGHCTLQISNETIIVTGGDGWEGMESYVTEYHLSGDGNETPLSPLTKGRRDHACGVYRGAGGEQVLLVTGGTDSDSDLLASTEVAVYSSGGLDWRVVEGGELPSTRYGLRAAMVGDVLHVTGGAEGKSGITSILAWDPVTESWQDVGELNVGRFNHAA